MIYFLMLANSGEVTRYATADEVAAYATGRPLILDGQEYFVATMSALHRATALLPSEIDPADLVAVDVWTVPS